jgi:hypothetical protein
MIVEKQLECRLAGETGVLGENLPQHHFGGSDKFNVKISNRQNQKELKNAVIFFNKELALGLRITCYALNCPITLLPYCIIIILVVVVVVVVL